MYKDKWSEGGKDEQMNCSSNHSRTEKKLLQDSMVQMLKPLNECESSRYKVNARGTEKGMGFAVLTSYCRNIPKGKGMLCVKHCIAVIRPCMM